MKQVSQFICVLCFMALVVQARAQNIYTDRPTQTTSSAIVPKGAFQVETGFYLLEYSVATMQPNGNSKYQYFSLNNTLLRYGVSERFELRFSQEVGKRRQVIDGNILFVNDAQVAPTMFGAKVGLVKDNSSLPDIGLIVSAGGGIFEETQSGLLTDIRLAVDVPLAESLALSANLGMTHNNGFENRNTFYTLMFAYGLNDQLGVFIESYGGFPTVGQSEHAMDAGLTYLLSSSLQIDVYGGTGLSDSASNLLLGFGLSKRFLK